MLLGAKEVAALLSVSERTAIRMFQSGEIRAFQVNGKLWRTRRENVDAYVARNLGEPLRKPVGVAGTPPSQLRHVA